MKKISRVLYLTCGLMIALYIFQLIEGESAILGSIGYLLMGISFLLVSVGLVIWRRKGYSYLELLPSFRKSSSNSKTKYPPNKIHNTPRHELTNKYRDDTKNNTSQTKQGKYGR